MERTDERAGVHSARYSSRSPTQTADAVRKKQQLSKSQKREPENQQTTFTAQKEVAFAERNRQPGGITDKDETKGDEITITVKYFNSARQEQTLVVKRSCTLEEYMKWNFILSSAKHLDQFNVYLKRELDISLVITSNSVISVQNIVNGGPKCFYDICDIIVKFAMDHLGKGLRVCDFEVQPEQLERCVKQIKQSTLGIHVEVLRGRLYYVFRNNDTKAVTEYVGELVNEVYKQRNTRRTIPVEPVWKSVAQLINLDHVLQRHCDCPELKVMFKTTPEKFIIVLDGPETAVDMAEQELKRLEKRIQCEKCKLQVTSKFALLELQVETFLDDYLSKHNIQCVTRQIKDGICIYAFNDDCIKSAMREIEGLIIEKTCIITGDVKNRKETLVLYIRNRWHGLVVIHIEDSGLLHIVGVKECVEDTCQMIMDLKERKKKKEDFPGRQTCQAVETETVEVVTGPQKGEDESQAEREIRQDVNPEHALGTGEEPSRGMKVGNKTVLDKSAENDARISAGNFSNEKGTDVDLRRKQILNEENGTKRRTAEGNMPTVENSAALKHTDGNANTKEEVKSICGKKQEEIEVSKIEEQRNISKNTKEFDDSALKYNIHENTGPKASNTEHHEHVCRSKESETISEYMDFVDKKVWQFMMKPVSRTFLCECANKNNVIIHQYMHRGTCADGVEVIEDVTIIPKEGTERTVLWQTIDNKQMVLTMKRRIEDAVDPGCRFCLVKFAEYRNNKDTISVRTNREKGVTATLRVPSWNGGKENEIEQLMGLLTEFISQMEETKMGHVLIQVEAVNNWPETSFIPCVISEAVEGILFGSAPEMPNMVTLFLRDEKKFEQALPFTEKCIRKRSEAERAKQNKLQVIVMSGELDKTKADVIVNTTSRDLELSNGKVSATLLKAAGSGIQTECRKKYPKGISRHDVAVTGGYKLKCENVFHIALDRYIAQQEMNSIESIRSFMKTCLEIASGMKHKTIAFPAIGTGVLKYPIDLVAAAMFESVERFKSMHTDTSLTTVFFVIYPTDVKVLEIFKRNEETLEKPPEDRRHAGYDKKVQLRISGEKENVALAKSCVSERIEEVLYDSSKGTELCFHGVTHHVYLALRYLFEEEIKTMYADGINVKHNDDTLLLSGKRKELKRAGKKMKGYIESVSKYRFSSLSVQGCNTEAVEGEVQLVNQNKDVVCIFDKFRYIVHIYAHSSQKVRRVLNLLKDKLQTHCPKTLDENKPSSSFVIPKSDNGEERFSDSLHCDTFSSFGVPGEKKHTSVQENSFDGKENKETKEIINKCSKSVVDNNDLRATKQHIRRQFSWDQHTKNCKIFQSDKIVVRVYEADILDVSVECIVNPANKNLGHHGGLANTIASAAGDRLERESAAIMKSRGGSLPVTSVVSTTAGKLNYKCILHAVGPCWYDYSPMTEARLTDCLDHLRTTVINCFIHAEQHGIETIALPTISSGLFGVPKELCAIQYVTAIQEFSQTSRFLKEIHIVDVSHDMIALIHSICDSVIVHGKAVSIDMKNYIQGVDTSNKGTADGKTHFKNTRRDKLEALKSDDETTKLVKNIDRNQETYRDNGTKLICAFSSNHVVKIYEGNILTLQGIQALVCSDNRKGEAKGEVSEQLLQKIGKEYETEKSGHFKEKHNYGDVITTSGGKSSFELIVHAITPKQDIKALHMMYILLFEEIVKKNISCIAFPLLGTGAGKFGPDEGAQVLLKEWAAFCSERKDYPLTIHLVLREKTTSDLVKDIFRKYIDGAKILIAPSKQSEGEEFKHEVEHSEERGTKTDNHIDSQDSEDDCVICMDKVDVPKRLKCGHTFCTECIEGYFRVKAACPSCGQVCGVITGDQPDGRMEIVKEKSSCVGYEGHRTLAVSYYFPPGTQGEQHPRPGSYYRSISRTGYLPDTKEGREVCAMLKVAFERRLVFTIGTSRTTGEEGVITWNDIHHKTDMRPNTQFGYPDKTYLQRVREELAVKGVTEKDVEENFVKELKADTFRHTVPTDTTL